MNNTKPHIHHKLMADYAEDARETETPWERWEGRSHLHWIQMSDHPSWLEEHEYRRKPRTITINGREVPEPMRQAPRVGDVAYLVNITGDSVFVAFAWASDFMDAKWIQRGLVHSTEEAAIAHAEALLSFTEAK